MSTYALDLVTAKAESLARLLRIVRESTCEVQVRLAAATILRLPAPVEPAAMVAPQAVPTPRAASPSSARPTHTLQSAPQRTASPKQADPPLTPAEIAALARELPNVSPSRFTRKHSPAYWRDVLARAAAPPSPANLGTRSSQAA